MKTAKKMHDYKIQNMKRPVIILCDWLKSISNNVEVHKATWW